MVSLAASNIGYGKDTCASSLSGVTDAFPLSVPCSWCRSYRLWHDRNNPKSGGTWPVHHDANADEGDQSTDRVCVVGAIAIEVPAPK